MLQQKYNRIALPLFFIIDTLGLILMYLFIKNILLGYYFDFTQVFALSLAWILPSLFFKSFDIPRTKSTIVAVRSSIYSYFIFIVFYSILILIGLLPKLTVNFHFFFLSFGLLIIVGFAYARFRFIYGYRIKGKNVRYAVFIGDTHSQEAITNIKEDAILYGYQFVNFIDRNGKDVARELKQVIMNRKVNLLFVLHNNRNRINYDSIAAQCDDHGIRMKLLLTGDGLIKTRTGLDVLGGFPVLDIRHEPLLYLGNRMMKRSVDVIMSTLSIVCVMSWLPIVVKIAQMISYPGSLFFKQKRIGRNGEIFNMIKFRTMVQTRESDLAKDGNSKKTREQDERVPWFGKLLRRTNLDEYPQFFNVLFGSMSTVGPRPHMVGEDEILEKTVPKYRVRRFVKPGITGWAAINGYRGGTDDMELMMKRTNQDIWYLENWSIWLDIKIMAITVWQMLTFRIPKAY